MEFLQRLHQVIGAAIAASTTKTGHADLGGNWELEVAIGDLQYESVFTQAMQQEYKGILGLLNIDDYAALKALYQNTDGANWTDNTGWKDWDFNNTTPPDTSVMSIWKGVELSNDRVSKLSLHSNNLSGTIPTELGNLSNLRFLDLGANSLSGTIPTSFGNLSQLGWLVLSENQLTGSIPSELGNLTGLYSLNLSSN